MFNETPCILLVGEEKDEPNFAQKTVQKKLGR